MKKSIQVLAGFSILVATASTSQATYSIAAVDRKTQAVGAAGMSCTGNQKKCAMGSFKVKDIYKLVPGKGVLMSQNQTLDDPLKQYLADLIGSGVHPKDVITFITNPALDPSNARQFAVLNMEGYRDSATCALGNNLFGGPIYADHQGGSAGEYIDNKPRFSFATQGNTLNTIETLANTSFGFLNDFSPVCQELPEKLIAALVNGAKDGGGDFRSRHNYKSIFNPDGLPGDDAFVEVRYPNGTTFYALGTSLADLQKALADFRAVHPCGELDNKVAPVAQSYSDPILPYRNYCASYALYAKQSSTVVQKGSSLDLFYSHEKRLIEQDAGLLDTAKYELTVYHPNGRVDTRKTASAKENYPVRTTFQSGIFRFEVRTLIDGVVKDIEKGQFTVP